MKEGHSPIPIVACDTNLKEEEKLKAGLIFTWVSHAKTAQWSSELIFLLKLALKS